MRDSDRARVCCPSSSSPYIQAVNFDRKTVGAIAFTVTPRLLVQGLGYALLLALVGGALPAIRAARLPIVSGLRAL